MRLTRQFAIAGALAAIVPLLLYGAVSLRALRQGSRQSVTEGMVSLTHRTADQIDDWLMRTTALVVALGGEIDGTRLDRWQQERALRNWTLAFPEFRELTLFDANGAAIVSTRMSLDGTRLPVLDRGGVLGSRFSPLTIDDDLLPTFHVGVRVEVAPGSQGLLVGTMNLERIWRVVDDLRVGLRGFAMLVDDRGQLFAHGDPDRKGAIARGERLVAHPLVRADVESAPNAGPIEYVDEQGVSRLAVAAHLASANWLLIVEQPTSEAFALADRLQDWLLAAIAAALAVMIGVGVWLGRSLIDPITTLVNATESVAAGRLDTRVALSRGMEFRKLGEAFNRMAARLRDYHDATLRQEREALLGHIAAGLVHDFSHPVHNLSNTSRLWLRNPDDPSTRDHFARAVERETGTMRRLLDDLRELGHPRPLERFKVDIRRHVGDAVESARGQADAAGVALEMVAPPGKHYALVDSFALSRVWQNLVQNAIEATPRDGNVVVSLEVETHGLQVAVHDTGAGIEAARLANIFDAFVTTKRHGLGLGLAISKRIVEQLGGTIAVTSTIGQGTRFVVWLPSVQEEGGSTAESTAATLERSRG
jgi:signal transduction histidine kinase